MSEQERANHFSAALDQMLAGQPISPASTDVETADLLEVAARLNQLDLSEQSRGRASLRSHLLNHINRKGVRPMTSQERLLRRAALAVAILLILIVTVLAVPPLRAVAQDVLARIGLLTITNEPTDAELFLQGEAPRDYTTPGTPSPSATPDAAIPLYVPSYVPEGYEYDEANSLPNDREFSKIVPLPNDPQGNIANYQLNIQQFPKSQAVAAGTLAVGEAAQVSEVTVSGNKAVWIEHSLMGMQAGRNGEPIPLYVNYLMWETDGTFFMMRNLVMSPAEAIAPENQPEPLLSRDEMLKIAESLKPASP